jgi:hypothetical protein
MKKKFDLGLFHGRFNPINLGMQQIIDKMLAECNKVIILVGNGQAMRTEINPFTVLERVELIKKIYGNNKRVIIGFYPDPQGSPEKPDYNKVTREQCKFMGDWILGFCKFFTNKTPDAVYGGPEMKLDWFYTNPKIKKIEVPRDESLSGIVKAYDYLKRGNKKEWMEVTDKRLHSEYERLRKIVLSIN